MLGALIQLVVVVGRNFAPEFLLALVGVLAVWAFITVLDERVRLFCVGGPEGSRRGCERHGKSYLTRRRRAEEGDGGGSLTGGAIPSA